MLLRAFALDLAAVSESTRLTGDEIVRLHSEADYVVRMIGFMPGFPYLAGLPAALQVPREERPRLEVPAGSVAIAGNQAGIYPVIVSGGWQVIGRTPIGLFDPRARQSGDASGGRIESAFARFPWSSILQSRGQQGEVASN